VTQAGPIPRSWALRPSSGGVGIEHDCDPLEPGRDFQEQLKPLATQRSFQDGEAGDIATRLVEGRDDTAGDGIAHVHKDDRDSPRLPLEGNGRRGRACHDHGHRIGALERKFWYASGTAVALLAVIGARLGIHV
jgi:hypothetical protein